MPVSLSLKLPVVMVYSDCTLAGERERTPEESWKCCLVSGAESRGVDCHGQWLSWETEPLHLWLHLWWAPPKEQLAKTDEHFVKEMRPIKT